MPWPAGRLCCPAVAPVDMDLTQWGPAGFSAPASDKTRLCPVFHFPWASVTLSAPSHIHSHYTSGLIFPQGSIKRSDSYLRLSVSSIFRSRLIFLPLSSRLYRWAWSRVKEEGKWRGDKSVIPLCIVFENILGFRSAQHIISRSFVKNGSDTVYCPPGGWTPQRFT